MTEEKKQIFEALEKIKKTLQAYYQNLFDEMLGKEFELLENFIEGETNEKNVDWRIIRTFGRN